MQPLYWTPKRIKELKAAGYKLHASPASLVKKSDQAISLRAHDGERERATGPGLKPQAPSSKHQASSAKLIKQQATSFKPRG